MNREQRKDIFEAVGFAAIIASLVFVGLETRNSSTQTEQNTQAIEIAAYQELMNNISDWNALTIESRDAAEIIAGLQYGVPDVDAWRRESALFMLFRHGDIAFFMYERGAIDEARLQSTLRPLPLYSGVGRDFWTRRKMVFVESYQQYVDQLLAEGFFGVPAGEPPPEVK